MTVPSDRNFALKETENPQKGAQCMNRMIDLSG